MTGDDDGQGTGEIEQGSPQAQEGEAQDNRGGALLQELTPAGGDARAVTLSLLNRRAADATLCPSEVARALAGPDGDWRALMPSVHGAVRGLAADEMVALSWKGATRAIGDGPYRIGRARPVNPPS